MIGKQRDESIGCIAVFKFEISARGIRLVGVVSGREGEIGEREGKGVGVKRGAVEAAAIAGAGTRHTGSTRS